MAASEVEEFRNRIRLTEGPLDPVTKPEVVTILDQYNDVIRSKGKTYRYLHIPENPGGNDPAPLCGANPHPKGNDRPECEFIRKPSATFPATWVGEGEKRELCRYCTAVWREIYK